MDALVCVFLWGFHAVEWSHAICLQHFRWCRMDCQRHVSNILKALTYNPRAFRYWMLTGIFAIDPSPQITFFDSSGLRTETLFWHSFWHTIWKYIYINIMTYLFRLSIWHSFWHILWHSIWHLIWHLFWHTFWQIRLLSGKYSDILSGILSGIYSGILAGIYSDILSGIFSGIHSGIYYS